MSEPESRGPHGGAQRGPACQRSPRTWSSFETSGVNRPRRRPCAPSGGVTFAREDRPRARGTVRCRHDGALVGEVHDVGQEVVLGVGKPPLTRLYLVDSSGGGGDIASLAADPVEHGLCADHPGDDGAAQMAEIARRGGVSRRSALRRIVTSSSERRAGWTPRSDRAARRGSDGRGPGGDALVERARAAHRRPSPGDRL